MLNYVKTIYTENQAPIFEGRCHIFIKNVNSSPLLWFSVDMMRDFAAKLEGFWRLWILSAYLYKIVCQKSITIFLNINDKFSFLEYSKNLSEKSSSFIHIPWKLISRWTFISVWKNHLRENFPSECANFTACGVGNKRTTYWIKINDRMRE